MGFIFRKTISLLILLLILKSFAAASIGDSTDSKNLAAEPFVECWRYPTEELSKFSIASDKVSQIFLPLIGGRLQSVEQKNGSLLWSSELGGEITAEMVTVSDRVFVVVRNAPEQSTAVTIRALSRLTGVAQWQNRVAIARDERVYLSAGGETLTLITEGGKVHGFDAESGKKRSVFDFKEKSELNFKDGIKFPPVTAGTGEIFLTVGQKIIRFSTEKNLPVGSAVVRKGERILSAGAGEAFLVSDRLGNVSLYSTSSQKRLWTTRTGAEISDVVEAPAGFLLSSNDNFVYYVTRESGRRLWKKRLASRARGILADERTGVFSRLAGDEAVFIEIGGGKIINRISLTGDNVFVNRPLLIGKYLFAPTERGVYAYGSSGCQTKGALF